MNILRQRFIDWTPQIRIGLHWVEITSNSDTLTVPDLLTTETEGNIGFLTQDDNEVSGANILVTNKNTITFSNENGKRLIMITMHSPGVINFGAES